MTLVTLARGRKRCRARETHLAYRLAGSVLVLLVAHAIQRDDVAEFLHDATRVMVTNDAVRRPLVSAARTAHSPTWTRKSPLAKGRTNPLSGFQRRAAKWKSVNLHMGSFTNMTTRHPRNPDTYHSHGDGNASENRLDCAWRRMLSCCLLQQNELKWSVRDVQIVQIGVCVAGTYLPTLRM